MVLTTDIPDSLHRKIEAEKKRSGLSKSRVVRKILLAYYDEAETVDEWKRRETKKRKGR